MKRFLLTLILFFSFQTPSLADDIRDFQIEGMSIGDSLLDHFNQNKINKTKRYDSTNTSWTNDEMYQLRIKNIGQYGVIQFHLKKNDKKYIIYRISAIIMMRDNIQDCYSKQNEIASELQNLFPDIKKKEKTYSHRGDKSGKSKIKAVYFLLNNQVNLSDKISVDCYDWSKKMKYTDHLRLVIASTESRDWIINKAYK